MRGHGSGVGARSEEGRPVNGPTSSTGRVGGGAARHAAQCGRYTRQLSWPDGWMGRSAGAQQVQSWATRHAGTAPAAVGPGVAATACSPRLKRCTQCCLPLSPPVCCSASPATAPAHPSTLPGCFSTTQVRSELWLGHFRAFEFGQGHMHDAPRPWPSVAGAARLPWRYHAYAPDSAMPWLRGGQRGALARRGAVLDQGRVKDAP